MNRRLLCGLSVAWVVNTLLTSGVFAADFATLLKRVPSEANVLVMVDADRLLASPMAQQQGWKKKLAQDVSQRPLLLPPSAHKLVRAISIDLNNESATFEITLLETAKGLQLSRIADKHKGYVEKISNVDAAWLPEGAYTVKLTDDLFGVIFPANRQFLSRWVRQRSGEVSRYLLDATYDLKPNGPQVLIAVDLEDSVNPGSVGEKVKEFASLAGSAENLKTIAKVLEGVRGAKLGITYENKATGRLVVSFEGEAAPLKPIAKPLVLKVLGNHGLLLDEMDDWQVSIDNRQLILSGDLTEGSLMRLSTLLELPSDLTEDQEEQTDAGNPVIYATQAHYKAVQKLLDDLFSKKKQTFGQYGKWADQYATKIDRLPLVNVDKDMLEYSGKVAQLLRMGSSDFKGVGIRGGARQATAGVTSYTSYGYYGGWGTYDVSGTIRGQEAAVGAAASVEMKRQIDDLSAAIRKVMAERYKVNF